MGEPIGTLNIPSLEPEQEIILKFVWNTIPNPGDYSFNGNPWHFCLLARILSDDDPIGSDINFLADYTSKNNNVAWKNITVIEPSDKLIMGSVAVGNPFSATKRYDLVFSAPDESKPIFEEAEVRFEMDTKLYNAWVRGGKHSKNL